MPADQKIEIELELQDKASATIQQIARSVSEVIKHIGEMGKASTGTDSGIQQTAKSVSTLGEKSKDTTKSFDLMSVILSRMAGPAGLVAVLGVGLYGAARAMDEVAGKRLRFENLSTDLGFTTDQMSVMLQTFKLMGMSVEDANSRMIEIGTTLKNIQTLGKGSDVFRTLSEMGRNEFAKQLVAATQGADGIYRSFQMINDEYNRIYAEESPRAAALFLDTVKGFKKSIAQGFAERSKEVKPERHIDKDIAKEFHQNKEDLKNATTDFLNRWAEFFQDHSNKLTAIVSRLTGMESGAWRGVLGGASHMFDPKPLTDPLLLDPPRALRRKGHKFEFEQDEKDEKDTKKEGNSTLERIRDSIKGLFGGEAKQHGGAVEAGQNYLVGEARPEIYIGGGDVQVVGVGGPQVIQPLSPGMISASNDFPQFMPNMHMPQVEMPPFENRFGDWNAKPFEDRFGDWGTSSVGDRFGDWTTQGGGTRSTPGTSSPNWMGGRREYQPNRSEDARNNIDVILAAEEGGSPSLNADITFKNIPPGVTTTADGEGFDNFKVNKSRALV